MFSYLFSCLLYGTKVGIPQQIQEQYVKVLKQQNIKNLKQQIFNFRKTNKGR